MLQIQNLKRRVGNNHIINGVDLHIKQGQAIGLVGPNGCGKTSLINLINGFNKAQTGSIVFAGKHITHLSVEQRAMLGIGRVFQSFGIFKNLTLEENLALAFVHQISWWQKWLPVSYLSTDMKNRISDILHDLDLYAKRKHLAGSLSGGQMRLLEIARLYLQDTELYLLDEPTAGVSPKLKSKVVHLLQKIIAQGKTVIIVEHDFTFLSQFVDSFCVMNDGQIVMQGDYQIIKDSPKVKELYFGH